MDEILLAKFFNFVSKFVEIVNKEKSKTIINSNSKKKPLTLEQFKLNIMKQMDKYKPKKFIWTQKRKNFLVIFINFFFFWINFMDLLENKLEKKSIYDDFLFEIINLRYIHYFGLFFENEVLHYKFTYFLNQIINFNTFYIIYYNFIHLYNNEHLHMLHNFNFLKIISQKKLNITGKPLEVIKESSITYSKYKRYFVNENQQEVDLDTYQQEVDDYIEDDSFFKTWVDDSNQFPLSVEDLHNQYNFEDDALTGHHLQLKENDYVTFAQDEWELLFGPKGFYDTRFLYSTLNRLRREEKTWFTDPLFYYVILDKLKIDFFLFDIMIFRILEIFLGNWNFFYMDFLYFNKKWEFVNDLLFPKIIFQLKIDLNTFLCLTNFLSWFRNHMYEKYIYTHVVICNRFKYRLLHISNFFKVWQKRILWRSWKIDWEYVQNLKSKAFFVINFKKEYKLENYFTYEQDICKNLYNTFFLYGTNLLDKNFITALGYITRKFYFYNINLLFYKILTENVTVFIIEELLFYHHENIYKTLLRYTDDNHFMWNLLMVFFEKYFFLNMLYNNEYIFKSYIALDGLIFGHGIGLHYMIYFESKIFWKFLNFGALKYVFKKFRFNIRAKEMELEEDFLELEQWGFWFLKLFKYYSFKKIKRIDVELIDTFVFWISRLYREYHVFNSYYDFIYNSRFLSNIYFCKIFYEKLIYKQWNYNNSILLNEVDLLITKGKEPLVFKLNEYWTLMFYKDLLLSLINSSILLNILFFFVFEQNSKFKIIYDYNRYFFIRHYGWNDVKKINI